MTDRPIIFSAPMVRALLAGTKTQTRRLRWSTPKKEGAKPRENPFTRCAPGDKLWVRETFRLDVAYDELKPTKVQETAAVWCCVDGSKVGDGIPGKTRVSIHMPRWASRLTLIVEAVRVEALQAISPEDAIAEGIDLQHRASCPVIAYSTLWNLLHGADAWEENPSVVALTFRVIRGNIDRSEG